MSNAVAEEGIPEIANPGPYPGVTAEQEENYAAALVRERDGYLAKVEAAKSRGDEASADYYAGRAEQVDEQLSILGDSASTAASRSSKRARRGKPKAADDAGKSKADGNESDGK